MGPLDALLNVLESQTWKERCRFTIQRDGRSATIHKRETCVVVRELKDGSIEVLYEHAIHEVTRERVSPVVAARLLLAVIERDGLGRIEVPDEPSELSQERG